MTTIINGGRVSYTRNKREDDASYCGCWTQILVQRGQPRYIVQHGCEHVGVVDNDNHFTLLERERTIQRFTIRRASSCISSSICVFSWILVEILHRSSIFFSFSFSFSFPQKTHPFLPSIHPSHLPSFYVFMSPFHTHNKKVKDILYAAWKTNASFSRIPNSSSRNISKFTYLLYTHLGFLCLIAWLNLTPDFVFLRLRFLPSWLPFASFYKYMRI